MDDLRQEYQDILTSLRNANDVQAMVMESFRIMLVRLLATGDYHDDLGLEMYLTKLYAAIMGGRMAKKIVAERMEWARRYGWLPWQN